MAATHSPEIVTELMQLAHEIERESNGDGHIDRLLIDIRTLERDLVTMEREVLEQRESEGLKGDAC